MSTSRVSEDDEFSESDLEEAEDVFSGATARELAPLTGHTVGRRREHNHATHGEADSRCGKWYGLSVAVFYACMSVVMTLVNKVVFATYGFHHPLILMLAQMVLCLVCLVVFKALGVIHYQDFDLTVGRRVAPLSVFFVGMVLSGLAALSLVNVPMYSALRKQTTVIVLIKEWLFLGHIATPGIIGAVCLMALGAFIAGWNDLNASVLGYSLVLLCCVVTASYTVTVKKISQGIDISVFGLLFYNNLISLPFVLALTWYTGELHKAQHFPDWTDSGFLLSFCTSSLAAFGLNYSIYLCTRVNSPLTTSVTGDLKNIGTDVIGLVAFGDVVLTPGYLSGIVVATSGGLVYSWLKLQSLQKQ